MCCRVSSFPQIKNLEEEELFSVMLLVKTNKTPQRQKAGLSGMLFSVEGPLACVVHNYKTQIIVCCPVSKRVNVSLKWKACKRLVQKGVSIENLSYVSSFSVNCYFLSGWWYVLSCA